MICSDTRYECLVMTVRCAVVLTSLRQGSRRWATSMRVPSPRTIQETAVMAVMPVKTRLLSALALVSLRRLLCRLLPRFSPLLVLRKAFLRVRMRVTPLLTARLPSSRSRLRFVAPSRLLRLPAVLPPLRSLPLRSSALLRFAAVALAIRLPWRLLSSRFAIWRLRQLLRPRFRFVPRSRLLPFELPLSLSRRRARSPPPFSRRSVSMTLSRLRLSNRVRAALARSASPRRRLGRPTGLARLDFLQPSEVDCAGVSEGLCFGRALRAPSMRRCSAGSQVVW